MATARRTSSVCWSAEGPPDRRASARARAAPGLVVLVEEGQGVKYARRGGATARRRALRREGGRPAAAKDGSPCRPPKSSSLRPTRRSPSGATDWVRGSARAASAPSTRRATSASGARVAVKAIPADGRADERARREAHAVARLDHPGIVSVFDAGEEDGTRFLVSELVRGSTLAQLEAAGEVSDRDVLRIGLALADALAHAHERGVIHRDVKPQNVMVPDRPRSPYGAAKLTDFGVAHLAGDEPLTRTGDVVGTLAYMAPEQAAGERVDERCDLYALGLVLYEGAGGRQPGARRQPGRHAAARRAWSSRRSRQARGDLPPELCAAHRPHAAPAARRARRPRRPRRRAGRGAAGGLRRGRHRRAAPARGRVRDAVLERPRRRRGRRRACSSCCALGGPAAATPRCPPSRRRGRRGAARRAAARRRLGRGRRRDARRR